MTGTKLIIRKKLITGKELIIGKYLNMWETVYWEIIRIWGRTSLLGSNRTLVRD
jgi:hypothetical protein